MESRERFRHRAADQRTLADNLARKGLGKPKVDVVA